MQSTNASSSSSSAAGKPDRLYIGNLSPTVDEYTLIQIFQKYGKITKLDFMFHKSGVLKGKPRGFAFVEFSNRDDALKAMVKLHDRLLRGRKLVVTYANSAPPSDLPRPTKGRRPTEAPKTTTLSLLKSNRRPQSAAAQIAAMEAKLATMAKRKPADEDYVPGQGTYSGSGTASPLPEGVERDIEMDGEAPIGQEEGGKAAQDLEKELEADFRGGDDQMDDGDEGMTETSAPTGASGTAPANGEQGKKSAPSPSLLTIAVSNTSLPPRPPIPAKAVALELATDPEAKAREEAIKRGLAGLPKKPVF